jgi:DNA-binding NarL/FixJ family response regulator
VTELRVLVVDDDVPTRIGLRTILDAEPDITVVGEADDGVQACALTATSAPDVVLMDVRMRNLDGLEATRRITEGVPRGELAPRVIVLTTFDDDEYVTRALQAGASGFMLKRARAEELVDAVRVVASGDALLTPAVTKRLIERFAADAPERTGRASLVTQLTERERQVLVLIARGLSNREIATELTVGVETVKTHVKRIFMKLDVRDRAQAVAVAYEARVVVPARETDGR